MNNEYILKKIVPEINEINTLKHLKIVNVMLSNVISIFFEINNEIHFYVNCYPLVKLDPAVKMGGAAPAFIITLRVLIRYDYAFSSNLFAKLLNQILL